MVGRENFRLQMTQKDSNGFEMALAFTIFIRIAKSNKKLSVNFKYYRW